MGQTTDEHDTGASTRFLHGGGEMGARIRQFDWNRTPLGPPAAWPLSLKTAVGVMLNCRVAMYIAWGSSYTQLYNDSYIPILGSTKHPHALGLSAPETWFDIWAFVGPLFDRVLSSGEAVKFENQRLVTCRNGAPEEAYFSFSYSPLIDELGNTTGVMATVWETTPEVIQRYYMDTLQSLGGALSLAAHMDDLRKTVTFAPELQGDNIPFLLWYEREGGSDKFRLSAAAGVTAETPISPGYLTRDIMIAWGFPHVATSQYTGLLKPPVSLHSIAMIGTAKKKPESLWVQPVRYGQSPVPDGLVIIGVHPQRPVEAYTQHFFQDIASQIARSVIRVNDVQQNLLKREQHFYQAMNQLPTMAWTTDCVGNVTFFNTAWLEFRGTSLKEETGLQWADAVHPDDITELTVQLLKSIRRRTQFLFEYRLKNKNGQYRWILDNGAPHYDVHGNFVGLIGTSLDITPRKEAEQSLHAREEQYQQLSDELRKTIDASPEIICTINASGHFVTMNAASLSVLEYPPEELVGRHYRDTLMPDQEEQIEPLFKQVKQGTPIKGFISRHWKKDGGDATMSWSGRWSEDDQLMYCVGRDVTESWRLEVIKAAQHKVLESAAAGASISEMFQAAHRSIRQLIPGTQLSLHTVNADGTALSKNTLDSMPQEVADLLVYGQQIEGETTGKGAFNRSTVIIENVAKYPLTVEQKEAVLAAGIHACCSTPIFGSAAQILGTLCVYFRDARIPAPDELDLLDSLAKIMGLAIQRQNSLGHLKLLETSIARLNDTILITEAEPLSEPGPRIVFVNDAFEKQTGYTRDEVIGRSPRFLQGPDTQPDQINRMRAALKEKKPVRVEIINYKKSGEEFLVEIEIVPVLNVSKTVTHFVAVQRDVTERKAAEAKIQHLAFYDALTALPNRQLMLDRLRQIIAAIPAAGHATPFLFLDLDNFKTINEALGHETGDLLLKQASQRLLSCFHTTDTVARVGGDEFVILLAEPFPDGKAAGSAARRAANCILEAFRPAFQLKNNVQHISPSIGIAIINEPADTEESVMKRAVLAMYQAKASGKNTLQFFDPEMQKKAVARVELEAEIRQAVQHNEFQLYYQPQVDVTGNILGVEALIRWKHPAKGMISPASFIPVAEESGLIVSLGSWVMQEACRQLCKWSDNPLTRGLSIAVNVSPHQFHHRDFVTSTLAAINECEADPSLLKLELTENVLIKNLDDTAQKMKQLKAHQIGFSLDDFGTGYSSLTYLKRLPLDQLKIDQSFVKDVMAATNDAAIARTIISLARSLGLDVIAEGVETREQLDFLLSSGCRAFQGYYFGRPVPAAELESLLQKES